MGYNAYARVEAILLPGTTLDQVSAACRPFLDWRGLELLSDDSGLFETGAAFDRSTQCFTLQITCECPHGFAEDTFKPLINAIGELAAHPFAATLMNEDTSNEDAREFEVIAGPMDQIGEFQYRRAKLAIDERLGHIELPPGSAGDTLAELAMRDCMTIATYSPDSQQPYFDAVARVAVDVTGLDLSEDRRDRIARLAAALAREIAGEELMLMPRPGAGAADWVLAQGAEVSARLELALEQTAAISSDHEAPRGTSQTAPLNEAVRSAVGLLAGIRHEALARARSEQRGEFITTEAPRG